MPDVSRKSLRIPKGAKWTAVNAIVIEFFELITVRSVVAWMGIIAAVCGRAKILKEMNDTADAFDRLGTRGSSTVRR